MEESTYAKRFYLNYHQKRNPVCIMTCSQSKMSIYVTKIRAFIPSVKSAVRLNDERNAVKRTFQFPNKHEASFGHLPNS